MRELPDLLQEAREGLGAYVNAPAGDLVFVPNATFAANVVARSPARTLPPTLDLLAFQQRLHDEHHVEVACTTWGEPQFIRVSVQAYNTQADVGALLTALNILL